MRSTQGYADVPFLLPARMIWPSAGGRAYAPARFMARLTQFLLRRVQVLPEWAPAGVRTVRQFANGP